MSLKDSLLEVCTMILIVLVLQANIVEALTLSPVEKSWNETFVVPAGNSVAVRGILRLANTQVNGSFTVRSCCGYSTNDINFTIFNVDFSDSRDYGTAVNSLSFTWNTGSSAEYEMHFDNKWGKICDQNGCHPDPTHPSSHNKTIELSVREVAPATFTSLLTKSGIILGIAVALGAGLAISGIVVLRERKIRGRQNQSLVNTGGCQLM